MKQFLLAALLIAIPAGGFALFQRFFVVPEPALASTALGDLSSMRSIVTDAQALATKGDLAATGKRMTDFETAWDAAQPELRAIDTAAWGSVDEAHDVALKALRATVPDAGDVVRSLAALVAVIDDPAAGSTTAPAGEKSVAGVSVTDGNGRTLPCEEMLESLRDGLASTPPSASDGPAAQAFLAKGTERCNADDDARADGFFAQGLALLRK